MQENVLSTTTIKGICMKIENGLVWYKISVLKL